MQPIELLWGKSKREVARQYVRGRNIHETKQQMQAVLRSIDAQDCARFFRDTDKHLEQWLQADEELQQFTSFAAMIDSPALAYKTHEDDDRCDDEHSDESDSDEEEDEAREEE